MNTPDSTPPRIAVIGPSQSGKTCLAVGLYATSLHGFTIQPRDGSATTYLADRKVEITKRKWPGANLVGKKESIRLDFVKKGNAPVLLDVPEYGGEILQDENTFKAFANEYLRNLDGVLILLNPGAAAFQSEDATLREDYMIQYRRVVSFLTDKNNGSDRAFVALVVTAADRLAPGGDLRRKRAVFDECAKEVENLVNSSSFRYKWFHVSITGRLDAQDNPKLANGWRNSASRPFLWLLWKIKWGPIRRRLLRRLLCAGIIAAALAASYGVYRYTMWKRENAAIQERVKQLEHLLEGNNPGDAIVIPDDASLRKAVDLLNPLYSNSLQLAQDKTRELEPSVWTLFKRRIDREIEDIKIDAANNATVDAVLRVDGLFDKFAPRNDPSKTKYEEYHTTWNVEREVLLEKHEIQVLIDKVEMPLAALAGRHGNEVVTMLFALYGELAKVNPPTNFVDLVAKRNELAARLDKRTADEFLALNKYDGLSPEGARSKSSALLELLETWTPATDDGKQRKEALSNTIENSSSQFLTEFDERQKKTCTDWVDTHVSDNRNRTGANSLWTDYSEFVKKNGDNPYFGSIVQRAVYRQTEKWFDSDIAFFRNAISRNPLWRDEKNLPASFKELEGRFNAFKALCVEVAGDKAPLQSSWAWHFAKLCLEQGKVREGIFKAFPQTLVVERIGGEISYYDQKKKKDRYPTNYRRTSFAARVEVIQRNPDGTPASSIQTVFLPFEKNGKDAKDKSENACDKKHKTKTFLENPVRAPIHFFEEVRMVVAVTDWNYWVGATTNRRTIPLGKFDEKDALDTLDRIDLSFDLRHSDGIDKPALFLSVRAHIDGFGIGDYRKQAEQAVRDAAEK